MKYLFINSVYARRSTGKLILNKCRELTAAGDKCLVAFGRSDIPEDEDGISTYKIGNRLDPIVHGALARLFDLHGFGSKRATKKLIKKISEYEPDVIWLHNLHGYYVNIELLFSAIKSMPKVKVLWTLHDCWAFTGHCAYFTAAKCERWMTGCGKCPQRGAYPKTYGRDHSARNYMRKKEAFCGVRGLTLITPSKWLAELTRRSFLSCYPVRVVNNTVDKEVFHYTSSDIKKKLGIENKHMVLGVAVGWEETKGMNDILKLRLLLDDSYVIVLVGGIAKRFRDLPEGIISIDSTRDQKQLAEYYSAADVLINPTHQDNYPTVNLESAACGTPVVTYRVGGSGESADPENVVEENDVLGMKERITAICETTKQ